MGVSSFKKPDTHDFLYFCFWKATKVGQNFQRQYKYLHSCSLSAGWKLLFHIQWPQLPTTCNLCQFKMKIYPWLFIRRILSTPKGQIISEWLLDVFIWTKETKRKYFCISALASKMGQIRKIMAHYHANKWKFIF